MKSGKTLVFSLALSLLAVPAFAQMYTEPVYQPQLTISIPTSKPVITVSPNDAPQPSALGELYPNQPLCPLGKEPVDDFKKHSYKCVDSKSLCAKCNAGVTPANAECWPVEDQDETQHDVVSCADSEGVIETICGEDGNITSIYKACEDGLTCENGACVAPPETDTE
jgi:hypothetical protein